MPRPHESSRLLSSMTRTVAAEERTRLVALFERFTRSHRPAAADVAELSDLPRTAIPLLASLWEATPVATRRSLVVAMEELAESNVELNFRRVFEIALHDPDPDVRAHAVSGLWEEDDARVLDQLLDLLTAEDHERVREAIALSLSRFAYLAVTGALDPARSQRVRQVIFSLAREDTSLAVRRRAVEAIGYYGADPDATAIIAESYEAPDHELRVSALHAMGRTLDRRWLPYLLAELESDDPELRYEAARACGELGSAEAVDNLVALVHDPDREVQAAAIGALGQIGGTVAVNVLRRLARCDDPVAREAAQDALAQALIDADPLRLGVWP